MIGTLEQEQGGEFLPGEALAGGEEDAVVLDEEATLQNQIWEAGITIDVEVVVELVIDGAHTARPIEMMVELLTEARGVNDRQMAPGERGGKFQKDAVEEPAIGG